VKTCSVAERFPKLTFRALCFCRHVWIIHHGSEMVYLDSLGECIESHSYVLFVVEWICWLNGQRKKAPTPEVRSRITSTLASLSFVCSTL
jgi:hypothetical protein